MHVAVSDEQHNPFTLVPGTKTDVVQPRGRSAAELALRVDNSMLIGVRFCPTRGRGRPGE